MTQRSSAALIVGSMAFDDLELPTGKFNDVVGGSATYAALSSAPFTEPRVVAVVGDDFPNDMVGLLEKKGVRTEGIERATGKTFRWVGRYAPDLSSRTTLDTQLNVFSAFKPKIPGPFCDSPVLLLGNIHPALQLDVLDAAKGAGLVIADTMNFSMSGEPKLLGDVLKRSHLLIVNDEEVRDLSGIHNLKRAAMDVLKRGPRAIIVKRGEHGAILFDEHGMFATPAYPLEDVVDPTGAGDSFAGGLVGHLASRATGTTTGEILGRSTLRMAMLYGTATASFCVEGVGTTRLHGIGHDDVERRVEEIKRLFEI